MMLYKKEMLERREIEKERDKVVVLDFGGQYSHLIVRRCRELGVYTELLPYDVPIEELKRGIERAEGGGKIRGIILSGSPYSVHESNSPQCSSKIVDLNIPLLGICYGAQLLAYFCGGVVKKGGKGEFGRTELFFKDSELFEGLSENGISPYRACGKAPPVNPFRVFGDVGGAHDAGARAEPVMGQSPTSSNKEIKMELVALAEQARAKGVQVIVIDTEVVKNSFIQMQLGYCREIASYSGGRYYPIADLTPQAVHDIVIQERERSLLNDLQAVLG